MLKRFSGKQKLIVLLAFVVLISLSLAACDSPSSTNGTSPEPDPDPETYQLSFDYLGEGNLPDLDGEYDEDSSVEISADPANGWEFYKWEGEGIQDPKESSTSVLVSADQDIKAIFIEKYDDEANDEGYAGWEGTEEKPYLIKNATQLDNIRNEMEAYFVLIEDIDLENYNAWNPIGSYEYFEEDETEEYEGFAGDLDGRNYAINNLVIEKLEESNDFVGLFRIIENGTIKNLNIINANVQGHDKAGILAGANGFLDEATGKIINVKTSGNIEGNGLLGGLVGRNAGTIENSSSYAIVRAIDEDREYDNIGGLVGANAHGEGSFGIIRNSYAKGEVHSNNRHSGGLVGVSSREASIIENSYADINITGNREVGGLVGAIYFGTEIINSHAKGNIEGSSNVGGLVGYANEGIIKNSYARGDVNGDEEYVGGLAGMLDYSKIDNSYATGNVFAAANQDNNHGDAGGLVGAVYNDSIITNSHATGEVESNGFNVGGLVGQLHGIIENSYAEGYVEGNRQIGGLVGSMNASTIKNSYAIGNVDGKVQIGGLVGQNYDNGIIETSFATGNVNAEGYYFEQPEDYFANAGGLVGQNYGEINRCYSTGDVSDTEDAGGLNLGGFVGRNREPGVISESFSTGKVTSHYDTSQVGGFTGSNYHTVHNSYWDINTSGYSHSAGGEGRTTEQMQEGTANDLIDGENIYEDWNVSIWDFGTDNEYPEFYWE